MLKLCNSFGVMNIRGFCPNHASNHVVPHFGAPRLKKFSRFMPATVTVTTVTTVTPLTMATALRG